MTPADTTTLSRLLTSSLRLARVQERLRGMAASAESASLRTEDDKYVALTRLARQCREVLDELAEFQREVRG